VSNSLAIVPVAQLPIFQGYVNVLFRVALSLLPLFPRSERGGTWGGCVARLRRATHPPISASGPPWWAGVWG